MVNKLTKCLANNVKAIRKRKNLYLQRGMFLRKNDFIKEYKEQLAGRSFTIAYINKELNKRLALRFILKSIHYKPQRISYKLLLNICSKNRFFCNEEYQPYIDF